MKIAILGYGNIGRAAEQAILSAPDMELAGVYHHNDNLDTIDADVVLLCTPTREVEPFAKALLQKGICTVDSFDIHQQIYDLRQSLAAVAAEHQAVSVISAGWDPGSDSVVRTLLLAMAPQGVTYTNFGPGRSMGHTVAAKAIPGIKDALSMTIPMGKGVHSREVYVELEEGADAQQVEALLKSDAYFASDETKMIVVESVAAINSVGHGVNLVREGISSNVDGQHLEFSMRINNPALTAQVMVSCARAAVRMQQKQQYGAYTLIELPPITLLPGDEEQLIRQLV
jgi:diaminopimelate dehydrogenase